jgi:urease accessory protein
VVATARADGTTALQTLASHGVIAARPTFEGLCIVGAGANPIGGDHLETSLGVRTGARLVVRSTGASLARRGSQSARSSSAVSAALDGGATLCWVPEPTVVAQGSLHEITTRVELAEDARLLWREEVVLGRANEEPGTWSGSLRVVRGGRACLDTSVTFGPGAPGSDSAAVVGCARALVSLTVVDSSGMPDVACSWREGHGARASALQIDSAACQITVWGETVSGCRRLLREVMGSLRPCEWFPADVLGA